MSSPSCWCTAGRIRCGLAGFAGLFVPVWWAGMDFTWYATGFDGDDPMFRVGVAQPLGIGKDRFCYRSLNTVRTLR